MPEKPMIRCLWILSCFLLLIYGVGCGESSSNPNPGADRGSATFSIVWPDEMEGQASARTKAAPTIDCNEKGITTITVNVYEGDTNGFLTGESFPCADGEGTVKDIPAGTSRLFKVFGKDAEENIIYEGENPGIEILAGQVTDVGYIEMRRRNNSSPTVTINNPPDGSTFQPGESISFSGTWDDAEDTLSSEDLIWSSDIDGDIGRGAAILTAHLSEGFHTITLTISDRDGATTTVSITVTIGLPPVFSNSIGMVFKLIPSGTFTMGSPGDEPARWSTEVLHDVTLSKSFYIQTTEVTQDQWNALFGAENNPSSFQDCGRTCPVEVVSWYDAVIFCNRLSQSEGLTPYYYSDSEFTTVFDGTPPVDTGTVYGNLYAHGYRLPTEAEWEYAARAGTATAFANGAITELECGLDPNLDAMGWYCYNSENTTHPVGQKDPNDWGLFDMHGNVWEWCQDWFGDFTEDAVVDPVGPETSTAKVTRGGNWNDVAPQCRSARRGLYAPGSRAGHIGFRVAVDTGQ